MIEESGMFERTAAQAEDARFKDVEMAKALLQKHGYIVSPAFLWQEEDIVRISEKSFTREQLDKVKAIVIKQLNDGDAATWICEAIDDILREILDEYCSHILEP